ncbi:MAG TPA: winged helix-turn-helix transcriptional regulator [Verrucomicrobiae bacterium]|nr:winged helix-turn-helix transcriptional regulator [Verrucomicrobiae bacterium]
MRSYGQYCTFARGLDVVGDRWVLLIVRELLDGPRRYNELLWGLPGIATNLLADRLRALEDAGVIERPDDHTYALTKWGEGLREVVYSLGRWANPLMKRPLGNDEFRSHWLTHPIHVLYEGVDKRRPRLVIEVDTGDAPMTIASANGTVRVVPGRPASPDLVLSGPPDGIIGLLAGMRDRASVAKVTITGDARKLAGLRPHPVGAA